MVPHPRLWLGALAAVVALALSGCSSEQSVPGSDSAGPVDNTALLEAGPLGDRALGDPNAPNVVVEYASLTCPHCQRFHTTVFPDFKEKYIDSGQVYFIYRPFSLNVVDTAAIMLTQCVDAERFFPLVDLLYDEQPTWAAASDPGQALRQLVRQAGISSETFDACVTNQEILDGVTWVKTRAVDEFGVDSTPTFFFNGSKRVGEQTLEMIDQALSG